MARVIVLGQFATVLALLAGWTFLDKFFRWDADFLIAFIALPVLALSFLVVLGWAAWPPRRRAKLGLALIALLLGAGVIQAAPWLASTGEELFFSNRREGLERLAADLIAYGRIRQMSDGLRHFKELNGELIAYTPAEVDTLRQTWPVGDVLARDGITPAKYTEFRDRLRGLKFIEVKVEPGYVAFLCDGLLDNLEGYLLVRSGMTPPPLNTEFFSAQLIELVPLGGGWYAFATT